MQITRGKIEGAQRIVIYGPEGIGKSTFASQFPNPVFIDTEGSTKHMDVARTPAPSSWTMLLEQIKYFKANPTLFSTVIIDTADWAERLCIEHICSSKLSPKNKEVINGIEDFGYGKGYTYLGEEYGRLLNALNDLVELGINAVFAAHAQMRKFEQPDEMGAYDRWEMKLQKKTAPLLKEWADMVLFANYKTFVVNVDNQGAAKGKNKAQGGKRIMYTSHHPCWDAKNRHDLPDELPFEFAAIAHCIPSIANKTEPAKVAEQPKAEPPQIEPVQEQPKAEPLKQETMPEFSGISSELSNLPKALADLMRANNVTVEEIQKAVASKGYYPADTPIENYDSGFISGVLVGAWEQVFQMILNSKEEQPY